MRKWVIRDWASAGRSPPRTPLANPDRSRRSCVPAVGGDGEYGGGGAEGGSVGRLADDHHRRTLHFENRTYSSPNDLLVFYYPLIIRLH